MRNDSRAQRRLADRAGANQLGEAEHRLLETEILVDREEGAGLLAISAIAMHSSIAGAKGFCTTVGILRASVFVDDRAMGVHPRHDVDQVELLGIEHLDDVRVPARRAEFRRGGLGLGRVDVADGGEHRAFAGKVAPGVEMVSAQRSRNRSDRCASAQP